MFLVLQKTFFFIELILQKSINISFNLDDLKDKTNEHKEKDQKMTMKFL